MEIWDKRKKELKEKRREISQEEEKCENPDAMGRAHEIDFHSKPQYRVGQKSVS